MRYLLAALILISVNTVAQKKILVLQTYKKNETVKTYKQILITGEGNMQAKMYLQNVSEQLTQQLKKQNIECRYKFLGDYHKVDTQEAFELAKTEQYDAIIRAIPRSTEEILLKADTQNRDPRTGAYTYTPQNGPQYSDAGGYRTVMTNDFDFILTEKSNTTIWEGRLKTDIDPTARNVFKKIASKMIGELAKNNIIPVK